MIVRIKMNKNHSVKEIDPEQKVENNNNDEVLRMKRILDDESVSESVVLESLKKLLNIRVSVKTLEATGIGRSIRVLQKHGSKDVRQIAWALVKKWKGIVDEYIKKESSVDSEKVKGVEEKFKATKRKLHEAYDEADKMKRKRRIQVLPNYRRVRVLSAAKAVGLYLRGDLAIATDEKRRPRHYYTRNEGSPRANCQRHCQWRWLNALSLSPAKAASFTSSFCPLACKLSPL
ncbi:hypothetical protein L1987_01783 [Smallanthus sonchifolius]|uniref:Uncharacterized protein n=1 Tax=Smallanthus sonchifolius TaxID=185202 RepID=A0ACB9K5X3_9ASTR|nr:hypothetical protein L1987_01783 [Smallanthus sonchifolius]